MPARIGSCGLLAHEYGVDLKAIHWHQGGVYEAGRAEKIKLKLAAGLRYTVVPDRSLLEMLRVGDLDAVLSARPLTSAGDTRVRRLFEDYRPLELAYWKKTGIFPIMHVVAMRREVYEQNRWVAMNLFKAFEAAKNRSLERLADITASYSPLPWTPDHMRLSGELLGADCWPYGMEANRATLEAFTQYAFEHGVCHRKVAVEELFPPEVQSSYKV